MVISMLKIRRPLGRLIFNMGIAIPGKTVFLIDCTIYKYSYICVYNIYARAKFWGIFGKNIISNNYNGEQKAKW